MTVKFYCQLPSNVSLTSIARGMKRTGALDVTLIFQSMTLLRCFLSVMDLETKKVPDVCVCVCENDLSRLDHRLLCSMTEGSIACVRITVIIIICFL